MVFQASGDIRYFTFSSLAAFPEIFHAILTRHGGSSPAPWASLNLGGTVGDDPEVVIHNKIKALQALQLNQDMLFDVWQVHGKDYVRATQPRKQGEEHQRADIIISNLPGLTLLMRFADCVPILLYDPIQKAVGLAHAGWQGTVKKVATEAVIAMKNEFGTQPKDLYAAIGPSIGPDHYQIGPDVIRFVQLSFGKNSDEVLLYQNGGVSLDLWSANKILLEQAGVRQVEMAKICTACHTEDWFSHRGERGKTGRFGVMIGIQ